MQSTPFSLRGRAEALRHPSRYALVDVNNFYVSCERAFNPKLKDIPMVVLSNGDGCVVARSPEVKALKVPMGQPWHLMQDLVKTHGIQYRSSNYTLYGDMSRRVMSVIGQFVDERDQEIYSIDECFLCLTNYPHLAGEKLGRAIKERVLKWCAVPVCVGIGQSKTLAKLANHLAKKRTCLEYSNGTSSKALGGVCDLTKLEREAFSDIAQSIDVHDVWGIGRKTTEHLHGMGIRTVAELLNAEPKRLRERFGVVMERTILELQGVPCSGIEVVEPRQQIISSRSFGGPVYNLEELRESVQHYLATAVYKLRHQESRASVVKVWLETNRFRAQDKQYHPILGLKLPAPSDDVAELTRVASVLLNKLYKPGYRYVKAGVMLEELVDRAVMQGGLFGEGMDCGGHSRQRKNREALLGVLDKIHERFGRAEVGVGHAGVKTARQWDMRRSNLSPEYTTNIHELFEVQA